MISVFRRFTESWAARIFFLLMAVAFVGWGISADLTRILGGSPTWVAKVGGQTIEVPAFQMEYQRALSQESARLQPGQEMTAEQRSQIGEQVLARVVAQTALADEVRSMRIVTPDAALVRMVRSMPAFQGKDGQFNRAQFEAVLRNNGYTEDRFLAQLRQDVAQRQLLSAVNGSVGAPDSEVRPLYTQEFEKRAVDMALFPFADAPEAAEPEQSVLQRWYDNHPDMYATPEYRRIKAIEISPDSLAPDINITDGELRSYYDEHKSEYTTQARRSADVISTTDEAKAKALADQWRSGADWATMQKAAADDGASAIEQTDAPAVEYPDPDLAKAVFGAPAGTVLDPVKGALGWFVVKVTHIVPGGETTFDQAKDSIKAKLVAAKAADMIYDRANKIDQILGNGGSLDELPGDLGLRGMTGTLDAQGNTQEGEPAPIPGPPALRSAIVSAAFQAQQGDPPRLTEVPLPDSGGSAYYALVVDNVIPPGHKPFDAVKDKVLADWRQDQRRRASDAKATAMMTAVQNGQSFTDAATAAGITPHMSPLVTRNAPDASVPPMLQRVMFGLKEHETTMVETPEGFVVAQLTEVQKPDPAKDQAGYEQARTAIARSISDDVGTLFLAALRNRGQPQVNQRNFDSIVQH